MYDPDDEAPILELQPVLELDHQYTRFVEAWNEDQGSRPTRVSGVTPAGITTAVGVSASVPFGPV